MVSAGISELILVLPLIVATQPWGECLNLSGLQSHLPNGENSGAVGTE